MTPMPPFLFLCPDNIVLSLLLNIHDCSWEIGVCFVCLSALTKARVTQFPLLFLRVGEMELVVSLIRDFLVSSLHHPEQRYFNSYS